MLKIVKEAAPTFADPHVWSDAAYNFIEAATEKAADTRASCADLLEMPFVSGQPNLEVMKPLLPTSSSGSGSTVPAAGSAALDNDGDNFGGFSSNVPTPRAQTPDNAVEEVAFGFE